MKEKVNEALKVHFRPEFLNRIDEVIVFHELSKDEIIEIVDTLIVRIREQLEGQGLGFELTIDAKNLLADKGWDPQMGARPLRRAIQRLIEQPLSEEILAKKYSAGQTILIDAENGEIVFKVIEALDETPPPVELAGSGSPSRTCRRMAGVYKNILVGTDGSATAAIAVDKAIEVAVGSGAALTVFSAGKSPKADDVVATALARVKMAGIKKAVGKAVDAPPAEALVAEAVTVATTCSCSATRACRASAGSPATACPTR